MVKEYRPRIKLDTAERIAHLAAEMGDSFEGEVNRILARYLESRDHHAAAEDVAFQASRKYVHGWQDPNGAEAIFDALPLGGWGEGPKYPEVMAGLVVADEGYGAEPIGITFTKNDLRALRDAITEVLNDGPSNGEDA